MDFLNISLFTQGKQNQSITIWNFCVQSLLRSLLMDILAARQETPFRIELDWSHILLTLCIERLREKKSELHLSTDFFLDFHLQYINLYSKVKEYWIKDVMYKKVLNFVFILTGLKFVILFVIAYSCLRDGGTV